jgi:hypothetical protein
MPNAIKNMLKKKKNKVKPLRVKQEEDGNKEGEGFVPKKMKDAARCLCHL